jgi:hypothetical protein
MPWPRHACAPESLTARRRAAEPTTRRNLLASRARDGKSTGSRMRAAARIAVPRSVLLLLRSSLIPRVRASRAHDGAQFFCTLLQALSLLRLRQRLNAASWGYVESVTSGRYLGALIAAGEERRFQLCTRDEVWLNNCGDFTSARRAIRSACSVGRHHWFCLNIA